MNVGGGRGGGGYFWDFRGEFLNIFDLAKEEEKIVQYCDRENLGWLYVQLVNNVTGIKVLLSHI